MFVGVQLLAAVAAGLAFSLTLRARSRDAIYMSCATVLALGANELAAAAFGREAAVFVATLVVGVAGGLAGSYLRRSPLVFIVPGVLMLVPGSAGFNSVVAGIIVEEGEHGSTVARYVIDALRYYVVGPDSAGAPRPVQRIIEGEAVQGDSAPRPIYIDTAPPAMTMLREA